MTNETQIVTALRKPIESGSHRASTVGFHFGEVMPDIIICDDQVHNLVHFLPELVRIFQALIELTLLNLQSGLEEFYLILLITVPYFRDGYFRLVLLTLQLQSFDLILKLVFDALQFLLNVVLKELRKNW